MLAFHKPYGVLSQFTPDGSINRTLADYSFPPYVYPIGRLDADSEGLLLLSDEARITSMLLRPEARHEKEYWVQVERIPNQEALDKLEKGVAVGGATTLPCRARILIPQPKIQSRNPPVRARKSVLDCWLSIIVVEGRNRQVRRMTAAVGHPTLRLIRQRIGGLWLADLQLGIWRELSEGERNDLFRSSVPLRRNSVGAT